MLQPSSACMVGHSWGGAEGRTPKSAVLLSSCPDGLCVQIDTGGSKSRTGGDHDAGELRDSDGSGR
jgi:hypothetical protein